MAKVKDSTQASPNAKASAQTSDRDIAAWANRLRWLYNPHSHLRVDLRVIRAVPEKDPSTGSLRWAGDAGLAEQSLHTGDYFTVEVRNDSQVGLYGALIDINSDNTVGIVYPHQNVSPKLIPDDGKWHKLEASAGKPALYRIVPPLGPEVFKLIATQSFVDFYSMLTTSRGWRPSQALSQETTDQNWDTAMYRFLAEPSPTSPLIKSGEGPVTSPLIRLVDGTNGNEAGDSRGFGPVAVQVIDSSTRDEFSRRKNYAVIFASDAYDHWPHLNNPIHDGDQVSKVLSSKYGFDSVQVIQNPTKQVVKDTLHKFQIMSYGQYDQLFVYFAGHGAFDPTDTGQGYVVTTDSPSDPQQYDECFGFQELQDMLDRLGQGQSSCKHILLVLDTCYGGAFDPAAKPATDLGAEGEPHLAATSSSQVSSDPLQDVKNDLPPPPDDADLESDPDYVASLMGTRTREFLSSGGIESVPDGAANQGSPFEREFVTALLYDDRNRLLDFDGIWKRVLHVTQPKPRAANFYNDSSSGEFVLIRAK